jgi:hypothetical protein
MYEDTRTIIIIRVAFYLEGIPLVSYTHPFRLFQAIQ